MDLKGKQPEQLLAPAAGGGGIQAPTKLGRGKTSETVIQKTFDELPVP
jgi:hypothetical protein